MRRAALPVMLVLAAAFTSAQTRTDFSGHWVLVAAGPERPDFDAFWLGTEAIVTQTGTTLTIQRVGAPERTAVFHLDGRESENVYTIDGERHIKSSRTTLGANLLISTDTTSPNGDRWLWHINRWSLDAEGTLLVTDTQICGRGECPSIVTNLRFRKQE